jgi:hypothetical protein
MGHGPKGDGGSGRRTEDIKERRINDMQKGKNIVVGDIKKKRNDLYDMYIVQF